MECKRCGNKDPTYFYKGSKGVYCRKCVSFKRILLNEELNKLDYDISKEAGEYHFDYPLTRYQLDSSLKTLEYLKQGYDVLLYCVCGAGKTEIVVKSISSYISRGLKVCYAISRREVVIELAYRFSKIFTNNKVASVYGDHHNDLTGDLIVCTTHQLFRYYQTFDLLILDEVDAFPLSGNETLMNIAIKACKGNIVYSTATLNEFLKTYLSKRKYKEVSLYVRPSLKPLIVPKVIYNLNIINIIYLEIILRRMTNQCIVFVSSKKLCKTLYIIFKKMFSCTYVYSDLDIRNENIIKFKNKEYKYIFSTTVLERGITIRDVNVVILYDRDLAFDKSSLIQMVGRVGRNYKNPYGKAYILSSSYSRTIRECVNEIKRANNIYEMSILRQ
ncbi:MAG: helicase-related protein [Erysipelotrichaceae bacterium]|nr:helicase-related protein [Erysipelotrichaceae bacterium]